MFWGIMTNQNDIMVVYIFPLQALGNPRILSLMMFDSDGDGLPRLPFCLVLLLHSNGEEGKEYR